MLAELLPYGAPEDLYLVTSHLILDQVHRNLIQRFDQAPGQAAAKRFFVGTIAVRTVPYFEPAGIRRYAGDSRADMIVHTALQGARILL